MDDITLAQQVAWFLEAAFPMAIVIVGTLLLTESRK